jgi:peroxisome-assembly ATPase
VLQKKVDSQQLLPDDHQRKVAELLQNLYQEVQNYEPPKPAASTSGFSWFPFGKKEEKKDVEKGLKGLYIYGSVGGGKTMIMDFFYDSCIQVVVMTLKIYFCVAYKM